MLILSAATWTFLMASAYCCRMTEKPCLLFLPAPSPTRPALAVERTALALASSLAKCRPAHKSHRSAGAQAVQLALTRLALL